MKLFDWLSNTISNKTYQMRFTQLQTLLFNSLKVQQPLQRRTFTSTHRSFYTSHRLSTSAFTPSDANAPPSDSNASTSPESIILDNALRHVEDAGWTMEAIAAGARDAKYPSVTHGLFPNGAIDLVYFFMQKCDYELRQKLVTDADEMQRMTVVERLKHALRFRLELVTPYQHQWAQAMGLGALPQNAPMTFERLARLVDEIWYFAGDFSTDIQWYQKRLVLFGIYTSAELFLLNDYSKNYEETWNFVDRRLEEAIQWGDLPQNVCVLYISFTNCTTTDRSYTKLKDVANVSFLGMRSIFSAATSLAVPLGAELWKKSPFAFLPNPISAFGNQIPTSIASSLTSAIGSSSSSYVEKNTITSSLKMDEYNALHPQKESVTLGTKQ